MDLDLGYMMECIKPIISKFSITMYMTLAATILALVFGVIFAVIIQKNIFFLSKLVHFVNSFLKGIPVLVILYILYYSMPSLLQPLASSIGFNYDVKDPPKLIYGIFAFGITYIPYMCDMIISAYNTIPKGQIEACDSIGFTTFQAMKRVIVPQMVVICVPIFGNNFVNILKATSLAYMVSIIEMMGAAKNYATGTQRFMETYIVAALIYWIVCIGFDSLFAVIEGNTGKYRRTIAQ
ncbi:amino acid ABC transporter permease [Clostridium tyrobutyricum]|uniref:amino acid ABC transporter permease n=1 Tax=Clostridium tyrobutyricum TaxID=1519 RepID=UPI00031438C3|nr:amino acid ABC transporter permease [Clostridium tyrobutyricum]MBV4427884.1 amino acid ABC transporter permease [Clostridium tyrobutyricum]MBV4443940.1 amino acid ABC transporter permease [Clostridium tyrobutyricum]